MKNRVLQTGGVLRVKDAREMVRNSKESDLAKARRLVEREEERERTAAKRVFSAAAKLARKWRLEGTLRPASIFDGGPERGLKKFSRWR